MSITPLTEAEVRAIHGIEDDSTRNNEITMAYHRLSVELIALTRSETANWCAWAKWTSKTIGVGIRWGEVRDLARKRVDDRHDKVLDRWAGSRAVVYFLTGGLLRAHTTATKLAGRPLADGNRDVFFEVAISVVRLLAQFRDQDDLDRKGLEDYIAAIVAEGPAGVLVDAPLNDMRGAMRCFVLARFDDDPDERAQRVLAGNVHLAAYEQARLQEVVFDSLDAPAQTIFGHINQIRRRLPTVWLRRVFWYPYKVVRKGIRFGGVRLATRFVLVVVTKDEVIRLGKPMPIPPGAAALFVPPVDTPTSKYLVEAMGSHLDSVDLTKALATVWYEYPQRVRFTAVLFRSRHFHPTMREAPMGPAELRVMFDEREEARSKGEPWVQVLAPLEGYTG